METSSSVSAMTDGRTSRTLHEPTPPLDDGVVRLRVWDDADIDQVTAACQDAVLQRFIPIPHPYGRGDAERYVARTRRQWATGEKAVSVRPRTSRGRVPGGPR